MLGSDAIDCACYDNRSVSAEEMSVIHKTPSQRMKRYKITCDLPAGDALKMGSVWALLIFVTAGVAGIFLPFFLIPEILNRTHFEEQ